VRSQAADQVGNERFGFLAGFLARLIRLLASLNPSSHSVRVPEKVLAGARLSRGVQTLVVGLEVGSVARSVGRLVASSMGLTTLGGRVGVGFAGASSALPHTLEVVRVTRRDRGLVAELVQATGVVAGSGTRVGSTAADAFGRGAVTGKVVAVKTGVATVVVIRSSAGFALSAHLGSALSKTRGRALGVLGVGRAANSVDFSAAAHRGVVAVQTRVANVVEFGSLVSAGLALSAHLRGG